MSKLYFRFSSMNAGKSLSLLQVAHNYKETGKRVLMFTSKMDNRYGVGNITSRLGPTQPAETFDADFDFLKSLEGRLDGVAAVLVDEAQFLSKAQVQQLHYIAQCCEVPVMAYGIRSDANGEPFDGAVYLLALAETLEELKTVCNCGKKATMNMRVDGNGDMVLGGQQVVIGGNSSYRAVCGRCFYKTRAARIQATLPIAA